MDSPVKPGNYSRGGGEWHKEHRVVSQEALGNVTKGAGESHSRRRDAPYLVILGLDPRIHPLSTSPLGQEDVDAAIARTARFGAVVGNGLPRAASVNADA